MDAAPVTNGSDRMNSEQAGLYLGVSAGTLSVWRCNRKYGLPFIKLGRLVRYRRSDLDAWLERRRIDPGDCSLDVDVPASKPKTKRSRARRK